MHAPGRPLRSVSFPATANSQNMFSNSAADTWPPSSRLRQQDRHHVVARMVAFVLRQQVGVGVQVWHALAGARVGHPAVRSGSGRSASAAARWRALRRVELGRGSVVGVLVADDPVRPVEQQPAVLLRHAEHVRQGQQRQLRGDVLGEVALTSRAGEGSLADGPGVAADPVLEPGDRARRERPAQQPPQPGVLRRIHVQHHPPHVGQGLRRGRVTDLGCARVEENRCGLVSTCWTSACLSTSQNPGPPGQPSTGFSATQATGAVAP